MINKRKLVADKMAYSRDDEVLVNALDLIDLIVKDERQSRAIMKLNETIDILKALLEIKECKEYQKIDIKG